MTRGGRRRTTTTTTTRTRKTRTKRRRTTTTIVVRPSGGDGRANDDMARSASRARDKSSPATSVGSRRTCPIAQALAVGLRRREELGPRARLRRWRAPRVTAANRLPRRRRDAGDRMIAAPAAATTRAGAFRRDRGRAMDALPQGLATQRTSAPRPPTKPSPSLSTSEEMRAPVYRSSAAGPRGGSRRSRARTRGGGSTTAEPGGSPRGREDRGRASWHVTPRPPRRRPPSWLPRRPRASPRRPQTSPSRP